MGNKLKEKFRQESDERENSFLDQGEEIMIKKSKKYQELFFEHDSCPLPALLFSRLKKGQFLG